MTAVRKHEHNAFHNAERKRPRLIIRMLIASVIQSRST
jgi:hypothetical protein